MTVERLQFLSVEESIDDAPREQLAGIKFSPDQPVRDWLRRGGRQPLLKADEEVVLAQHIEAGVLAVERLGLQAKQLTSQEADEILFLKKQGEHAVETMIEANRGLVISIARRYIGKGLPLADLVQEGNVGLLRAVKMFDYQKGFKFSTYATWWIRQTITYALTYTSRTIRLPEDTYNLVQKMSRERQLFIADLNREPTKQELAEMMDFSVAEVEELERLAREPLSLNLEIGDGETELGDLLSDPAADEVNDSSIKLTQAAFVNQMLSSLDERRRQVLMFRFGIDSNMPMIQAEVGEAMGITRGRVGQLERTAMERLMSDYQNHPDVRDILSE